MDTAVKTIKFENITLFLMTKQFSFAFSFADDLMLKVTVSTHSTKWKDGVMRIAYKVA